ncbi:MAG: hypothetical protein PW792_16365 [Acidobacteriaceae bacterium]|nr:hypothetical protein [Acidobacteriaceae bacterium]
MRLRHLLLAAALVTTPLLSHAQASALPSATPNPPDNTGERGRKLLDQMIDAMGGEKWMHRGAWAEYGKAASFYKGLPNPYISEFEEYIRLRPYAQRVVIVSKQGVFIPTSKRDVAEIFTGDKGYEVTYKGKKPLPKEVVEEYKLRRSHALDVLVLDWLKQPGLIITYDGSDVVDRKLADKITLMTATNDTASLYLDEGTHLPMSCTFQSRNETYKDFDTWTEQYNDWHTFNGVETPMTITRLKNGDMVAQRFLTRIDYDKPLPDDTFDPDRPLLKKVKK